MITQEATKESDKILQENRALLDHAHEVKACVDELLVRFNDRQSKLFDLTAPRRIFLFILTRSIKTYSSVVVLCELGYGQDVATLLRTLLENLITAKYILADKDNARHLAERFVAYKWVIFKRSLVEQELALKSAPREKRDEFYKRKALILRQVEDFKKKFNVTSDRGLLSWSGKTIRDMASELDPQLLEEYEQTFRLCSRFSHPSILVDQEYMVQDSKNLIFSPLPSSIGIFVNLKKSVEYFIEFANSINEQFELNYEDRIISLKAVLTKLLNENKSAENFPAKSSSQETPPIRECTVVFKVQE